MKTHWPVILSVLSSVTFTIVATQNASFSQGCPSHWYKYAGSCFLFEGDRPQTYENARLHCANDGAALLSVSSKRKHDFVVRWLQLNDPERRSWYTSGSRETTDLERSQFVWHGTGETLLTSLQYWTPGRDYNDSSGVIVYTYSADHGYRWEVDEPSNENGYICELPEEEAYRILQDNRDYDYGLERIDLNLLERGPYFVSQPHSTVIVGDPPSIEVECVASGNPEPIYSWMKGKDFDVKLTPELDPRYTITNGKLRIENPVIQKDSGLYRCRVENKFGVIVGHVIRLTFGDIGEFSNVPDAPVNAKAYEGAAIDCSKISYKPAVQYNWYKHTALQFIRPEFQPYMFISRNGKLYFTEVTTADEGSYHCLAMLTGVNRYTIGTDQPPTRTSMPIRLHVHDQAPKADWGPEIQDEFIAVFPKPPLAGQDVHLECFAYGTATSQFVYSWKREGKELPKNSHQLDHNRVLVLTEATLDDQGVYTCSVSRGTSSRDSKSIYLKLGAKPYFLLPIGNQHADFGSQLTWRCDARANPAASFRWLRNGRPLTSDPDQGIRVINNVLVIKKLDPAKHDGMYQCEASNNQGTSLSEGQLRVLKFPPNFNKYPMNRNIRASANGNLTLHCRPEGAPLPVIRWFLNGAELPVSSSKVMQLPGGHLRLLFVTQSDVGEYRCRAENFLGAAEDRTIITVEPGTHISISPADETVTVNNTVFLPCTASHAPDADMIYSWRFNGFLLDPKRHPEYKIIQETGIGRTGMYIRLATLKHQGHYVCEALTPLSADRKGAWLTVKGPPSEPAGIYADTPTTGNSSVVIRWTDGSDNGAAISRYIIEAANAYEGDTWEIAIADLKHVDTLAEEDTTNSVKVSGLNPGCGYRFRVISVNAYGRSPPSRPSSYVQMFSAKPILEPLNVGGGGGSVGDLTLTWDPLTRAQEAGSGIGYRLFWRRKTGKKDDTWVSKKLLGRHDHHVELVGVENYYLEYEFKVQAFNDLGYGPNSTVVTIMSAEDLPIAIPTNVYADGYNGSAMEVTWTPVPQTREYAKGKILGYQINYWHEEEVATDYKEFIRHEGQIDMGIVIGLKSDNFYFFTIQVYNSAGLGPISEYFFQETLHAPAFKYPEDVRVSSAGGHAVEVWWRGVHITQPEANVYGYVIYYWPANEHYRTASHLIVYNHLTYHAQIHVDPGVVYALRVSAYSVGGYGKKSRTTYFTLEGRNVLVDYRLAQTVEAFRSAAITSSISVLSLIVWLTMSTPFSLIVS